LDDKIGFFGQFECIDDQPTADALLNAAAVWLKSQGMEAMRGPQNLPINEATPGILVEGFETRPVVYYQYNKPIRETAQKSWPGSGQKGQILEVPVNRPMEEKLERVGQKVMERFEVTLETWGQRPFQNARGDA